MDSVKIRRMFDNLSDDYDNIRTKSFFNAIFDFLLNNLPKKSKVLDIGCGTGEFTLKLLKSGYYVRGFDYSHKMIGKAKAKNHEIFKIGNAEKGIPFDEDFDYAIAIDSWEYFQDPAKVLINVNKALKRDGIFIIITPNVFLAPLIILAEKIKVKKLKPSYAYFNSLERKVEEYCKIGGFKIVKSEYIYYYIIRTFFLGKTTEAQTMDPP